VKLADGTNWRLEYKLSGYFFFINTSRGFNGDGRGKSKKESCVVSSGAEKEPATTYAWSTA
jgi:hypothetical protein